MYVPHLMLGLFLAGCFALAARLDPIYQNLQVGRRSDVLNMLIGDSRRLFADHFFNKADAYFHSGYYPSIFDNAKPEDRSHMEEAFSKERHVHDEHCKHDEHEEAEEHTEEKVNFLGDTKDWIDAFGRNFYPSVHTHMKKETDEREVLPWLRLTAELDPHKVETYVVASYTLRTKLNKANEARQFLREGLRANPDSYLLLFELGRISAENHQDPVGARNLWELALKKWNQEKAAGGTPDEFVCAQILGFVGRLEKEQGNVARAIVYFEMLKEISPNKEWIQLQIDELKAAKLSP